MVLVTSLATWYLLTSKYQKLLRSGANIAQPCLLLLLSFPVRRTSSSQTLNTVHHLITHRTTRDEMSLMMMTDGESAAVFLPLRSITNMSTAQAIPSIVIIMDPAPLLQSKLWVETVIEVAVTELHVFIIRPATHDCIAGGQKDTHDFLVFSSDDHQANTYCNGMPPLHDHLHMVIIKYEYYVRTNTIFSQYYPNREYCLADVTHCSLVDIGSRYQPIKSSHDRSTQWVVRRKLQYMLVFRHS